MVVKEGVFPHGETRGRVSIRCHTVPAYEPRHSRPAEAAMPLLTARAPVDDSDPLQPREACMIGNVGRQGLCPRAIGNAAGLVRNDRLGRWEFAHRT